MNIGSLFSGYGGLDLAVLRVLGGHLAWVCDNDRAATRVLEDRHPGVPNLGDITAVDWDHVPPVDVVTGGFPCQDISGAGRQLGLRPGTRSGLWAHMAYAIGQLRPRLVAIENVRGLLSASAHCDVEPCPWCLGDLDDEPALRALGAVLGDLASLGYDAVWTGVRAADVGAPHARFRVFILAWPAAHPYRPGRHGRPGASGTGGRLELADAGGTPADPDGHGRERDQEPDLRSGGRFGSQGRDHADGLGMDWGAYGPAIARWTRVLGRPAPAPTEPGRNGQPRLSPPFVEWMMGLPDGWVTAVSGLSRADQLRLLGNGVVPQQAEAALRILLHQLRWAAA